MRAGRAKPGSVKAGRDKQVGMTRKASTQARQGRQEFRYGKAGRWEW
jgi:hypothetical protein